MKPKAQIELNFDRSQSLSHVGLDMAVDTANLQYPGWSIRCWQLFRQWLQHRPRYHCFLIEDFRAYLYDYDLIERPNSERAFGFIGQKAMKEGLVIKGEIKKVSNVKAHCANAQSWIKI